MNPEEIYHPLYARYGDQHWWPADSPYEVMVGAVLTQNTNWGNVEKAIANFKGNITPNRMESLNIEKLQELIRPAGFNKQKALYLKALTAWYKRYGYSTVFVADKAVESLRKELLAVHGVGRETADAVLLYAFGQLSFVVDAYTLRLLKRLGITNIKLDYESVKAFLEQGLPKELFVYKNFHACIVVNAKAHCRTKPQCEDCPLSENCAYIKNHETPSKPCSYVPPTDKPVRVPGV